MGERQRDLVRQAIVEFIGPFALMFIGGAAIIQTTTIAPMPGLLIVALAHGLAIGLTVAATGHISGGVFNPAITVGLVATRKMPVDRGVIYIISQLAGATVAALALKTIFYPSQYNPVNLGAPSVSGIETSAAILAEAIATFFLMYVIYGTAVDPRGAKAIAPLAIGLIISINVLAIGPVTGAVMNPSRSFGPELVQGYWNDWWVYWVGPIAGALVAAFLYDRVLGPGPITPEAGNVDVEPTTARETRTAQRRRRR